MNILFVYFQPIVPNMGGTERVTYTIASALKACGHHVFFLATHATEDHASFAARSEYVLINQHVGQEERKQRLIEACRDFHIDVLINEAGESPTLNSICSNKILTETKVVSCTHLDIDGLIKYFHRPNPKSAIKRAVLSFLSFFGIYPYCLKHYFYYKKSFKQALAGSDAFVLVTPPIARQLTELTGDVSGKITSILNPCTLARKTHAYNSQTKEKMLLYVGRLSHTKNVDVILKAWKRIAHRFDDWKLEIAGDGSELDYLRGLIDKYNIPRVFFHGQIDNVEPLYNRAEYLLLASDSESFSCVVLESMSCGCHPIVFDYPSAPIVIPNSRLGTRVKKHSVGAFANAISDAINSNVSNRDVMQEVANHLNQFDMNHLVHEWQDLLNQLHPSSRHE